MKMNKKISAALIAMLFVLGIVAVPVSAHFTMGEHTAAYPFRKNHFDPHVAGPLGYVFPGSGLGTTNAPGWYTGQGTWPGYQSPWPYWTSGVNNPFPKQGPMSWYQLDANNYAPFGAILTSTIAAGTPFTTMWKANQWASDNPTIESLATEHAVKGDLIFAFNVTQSWKDQVGKVGWTAVNFTYVQIMIPPEFSVGLARNNVVPSFTNNYDNIDISTRNREDYAYGPYWRRLTVYTDTYAIGGDQATFDKMDDAPDSWLKQTNKPYGPFEFTPWKMFGNITFSLVDRDGTADGNQTDDEWYYIRVNGMTAPTIAGAYQFKFRLLYGPELSAYFPPENWPVVLVKGEVDPAIITGTIRYGGWSTTRYGLPVTLPGRVRAVGIADDPYTGKSTGRPVEARGYFDAAWSGHYEVEGVAAGVYDIYASAAGYPEIKIASNVKLLKGQSYHIDGYLYPGVQIKGTVFSKCGTGEVDWFQTQRTGDKNIKIEIYRSLEDAQSMMPGGSTSKAVTWSPYGSGAASWASYGFKWGGFTGNGDDPHGVGPNQDWYVSTGASYTFQFGQEGDYGAPADFVGHVPSKGGWSTSSSKYLDSVTWVSGLGAGTYWVRAWLYGYVQTEIDGVTFMPVTFTVPSVEWPGNVWIPFDLRLSSAVKKYVHFHDVPGTLMENKIGWGWSMKAKSGTGGSYYRYLSAELVASGTSNYKNPVSEGVFAWEVNQVSVGDSNAQIYLRGFRQFGSTYGFGRNYGIHAGLYTVKAYMWGYVEQVFEKVNLGLCGTTTIISDHLYRGAKFNLTIYSKDWEHPTVDKTWSFPYMPIYVQITKDGTYLAPKTAQYVMPMSMQGYGNTSVAMWPYMWNNPYFMLKTHDAVAKTFLETGSAETDYACVFGTTANYYNDYFGPTPADGNYHFRLYDGSESYHYYWGVPGTNGQGYTVAKYPLSFESGIYDFKALTYGYVQKKPVAVGATKGNATSDILIKLTQGAELQVNIKLKHEGIFEGLPFDAHLRVRVLDDQNKLVGEYLTSDWWWQPQFEWTTNLTRWAWNLVPTDPTLPNTDFDPAARVARSYWRLNYVPQGTDYIKVVIAGLPDVSGWTGGYACDPCGATGDMGFEDKPIDAPYGIDAYPNYKGGWKVQVHVVPINLQPPVGAADSPRPGQGAQFSGYLDSLSYAQGILTGELYYTADMKPVYVNHLGPYELRYDVIVPGTHLGGEASFIFELDRRGLITGNVFGYTYCDDWRTVAWTNVKFVAADGTVFDYYTFDGWFGAYLNSGPYTSSVIYWTPTKGEGYKVQTMPYHVSDGAMGAFNVYLEQSQVPIPEFPVAAIVLASALAASLFILRRRRK